MENANYRSKFVVTLSEDISVQAENGIVSKRTDLKKLHVKVDIKVI